MKGSGYRKERKGSPLINTFRQFCDAKGACFVRLEKGSEMDTVIVDFSPLRVVDDAPIVSLAKQVARVTVGVGEDQTEEVNLSQQGLREGFHVEALQTSAIWGVRERELRLSCDREAAKELAAALVESLGIPKDLSKKKKKKNKKTRMPLLEEEEGSY